VAVCDFLSASSNFPPTLPVPTVLFQHNVETSLWRRLTEREMNPARKVACAIEAAKMASYERRALGWFHHVIAVSRSDRDQMLHMYQDCQISVVPTGVDTSLYHAGPSSSAEPPIVVFTGSMDWEPNIDAVEYFCWEIWPLVLATFPRARFQIVGRNPNHRVRRLASNSVEVTGTVSSVSDHLRNATLVVVPLRIGGGTRLKIYEAMAMGKAIVSTTIGAEGLEVEDGCDLVLADEPGSFSEGMLQLLRDPGLRRKYERAGAELVASYDWSVIARQFATVLSGVVADFATDKPPSAPSPVAP
jgi:glycosyltransferase involved in cell wall biosynthesis